jgi:hypothetical protein
LLSLPTTLFGPSHPLSPSVSTSLSYPSPNCHHTIPPSYTLTTQWLAYSANCTQPQPLEIPNTSTLHYKNRNIPKYAQGPQKPAAPISLPSPTQPFPTPLFSATFTNYPNFHIYPNNNSHCL